MNRRTLFAIVFAVVFAMALGASAISENAAGKQPSVTVTDMIGRQVEVVPGSYKRVVCI